MLLAIDSIREHPRNARTIAASPDADAALLASMRTIGLLQPILVVPDAGDQAAPESWELRAGRRRLAAARALGWTDIAAVEIEVSQGEDAFVPETAVSAAENMVRAPMHPVDQWRAIVDLRTSSGYSLDTAAAALGVPPALAKRMDYLGQMAPALLAAIGAGDLPDARDLRIIALAPHEVQIQALARATRGGVVDWDDVAEGCTCRRIPRSYALFDTDALSWDDDLFAQPDDAERFTTTDIDAFLALQRAALEAQIAKSKGRMVALKHDPSSYRGAALPRGWAEEYGAVPKRFARDDPRKVFASLAESGHCTGQVTYRLGRPSKVADDAPADAPTLAPTPRPPINKATQRMLAGMKADAVRERLATYKENGPTAMLRALLLLFVCKNVSFNGLTGSPNSGLAAKLVDPQGRLREDLDDDALSTLAAMLIGDTIVFDMPDMFSSSGRAAEWIATAIGAEMPRTDTIEVLKGINGESLAATAEAYGLSARGTVGALRKRLAGAMADWRAVNFGAAGPAAAGSVMDTEFEEVEGAEAAEMEDAAC